MGHLMQVLEGEMAVAAAAQKNLPDFGPGDVVQLKLAVPENKRRVSFMKGLCIARFNRGWRTSFTLRNFITGGGGLERTFPLYSPTIQEITVLKRQRTRRAKLYYLRDRQPREYRVL
ncbi:hypothetical protein WJX72_011839 [[Myrmecia] bisecta]|uniref:Ribosomal protein L19 n=1 Tax=[Myrmecia] bisecta TaxID=41462 RepID=A0AAW1PQ01_9CHLO